MKIRRATPKDARKLSQFIRPIIDTTSYYSPHARAEEVKKHGLRALAESLADTKYYMCFLALEEKEIVGFVLGRNESGVFWGDWIGVKKNSRRLGVAEALMKEIEKRLADAGAHKIWCDTRTTNTAAVTLLKKFKYKKLGTFKNGWYKQDFFLWEKDLG